MDDDTLDAIDVSDFWLDDTALDANSMPVQSLDFGLLIGDVVPCDGLQRPLLTSGSPIRTPVPRRANKQPINVTHVHQTVVQHFGPVAAACPATVAEGTSGLSCLESTLAVPQGSVYKPASRWRHRGKAQVAAGVALHVHDGAISFGTSLPWPASTTARTHERRGHGGRLPRHDSDPRHCSRAHRRRRDSGSPAEHAARA